MWIMVASGQKNIITAPIWKVVAMQVKMCPKCGSLHVTWLIGGIMGYIYTCQDCHYSGPFILEVDSSDAPRFQEEIRRSRDENENSS